MKGDEKLANDNCGYVTKETKRMLKEIITPYILQTLIQ